jgi:hypothetical protein
MLNKTLFFLVTLIAPVFFTGCGQFTSAPDSTFIPMTEKQVTRSEKNHALDNNDNFSPDDKFLCYDTRGTVFNEDIGNCQTIEKVEIATGEETVLYKPEKIITGEKAAPGVGAVSYHPIEDKVIFIHGPWVDQVKERGYYGKPNRTGVTAKGDGSGEWHMVEMRDIATDRPTTPGAHRGGTHRHEYSRNGIRVGFTYDDFLNTGYDRTIGYMEPNAKVPEGYTHYFALLVKPAKKGESKPGEIEKAHGDAWVDYAGTQRAFIGKVRAENGVDYENDLFVAEIPDNVDITTAFSGNGKEYPTPPKGIKIHRLTHDMEADGIVRGSFNGKQIAFYAPDKNGIKQVFIIPADGNDKDSDVKKHPRQVTNFKSNASYLRWHPSDKWIFSVSEGNIAVSYVGDDNDFGKTYFLTNDSLDRDQIVVSHSGDVVAYGIKMPSKDGKRKFKQLFTLSIDWSKIK